MSTFELKQSGETLPNLKVLHFGEPDNIGRAGKFFAGIISAFPNLDNLSLEGDWRDVHRKDFVKAVQKSNQKILTEDTVYTADGHLTLFWDL